MLHAHRYLANTSTYVEMCFPRMADWRPDGRSVLRQQRLICASPRPRHTSGIASFRGTRSSERLRSGSTGQPVAPAAQGLEP